jgi:hypothetical protein
MAAQRFLFLQAWQPEPEKQWPENHTVTAALSLHAQSDGG